MKPRPFRCRSRKRKPRQRCGLSWMIPICSDHINETLQHHIPFNAIKDLIERNESIMVLLQCLLTPHLAGKECFQRFAQRVSRGTIILNVAHDITNKYHHRNPITFVNSGPITRVRSILSQEGFSTLSQGNAAQTRLEVFVCLGTVMKFLVCNLPHLEIILRGFISWLSGCS